MAVESLEEPGGGWINNSKLTRVVRVRMKRHRPAMVAMDMILGFARAGGL